jgi:uncharacterized phage protein (TIGR02218 family)
MKKVHTDIVDLLTGYQFVVAELYTIKLSNSTVLRWTSSDTVIDMTGEFGAEVIAVFEPMPLEHGDITQSVGLSVDDVTVSLFCTDVALFGDVTAQHFSLIGGFDNAEITINLALMDSMGQFSKKLIHLFQGSVTDVVIARDKVDLTISSVLIKLDTKVPRVVYQPSCTHSLYDAGCSLLDDNFGAFGVVVAGSSSSQIWFNSSVANGYFELGRITFISGRNSGISRSVNYFHQHATAVAAVNYEFPFMPQVGDEFMIVPGCDKLRATCRAKFNNEVHFLGWEYMPVPEASL